METSLLRLREPLREFENVYIYIYIFGVSTNSAPCSWSPPKLCNLKRCLNRFEETVNHYPTSR